MEAIKLDNVTQATAAQTLLRLGGSQYSLKDYPMFIDIFNTPSPRKVMKAGRQVSKTITCAADMVTEASLVPHTPIIYANASGNQTSSFSTSKLDPFLLHSPIVHKNYMTGKDVISNVYNKRFNNFSTIQLSFFSESADRIRGISGHTFYLDEVQDILYDAVIDAEECLSAAPDPRYTYAGTSKSIITTLEYFWSLSSQKEWIIPCDCGKWNLPTNENIQKAGLCCKVCQRLLNTRAGQWHITNKSADRLEHNNNYIYDGYHIPQIILPLHCENKEKWAEVLRKFDTFPEYKFNNEVMGIAYGEGDAPITEEMLRGICLEKLNNEPTRTGAAKGAEYIVGGIDWGGYGVEGNSRTVLSIYAVYPERKKFIKVSGKIYEAGEPTAHVADIARRLKGYGAIMCFGDHGGGNFAMSQLKDLTRGSMRVVPVMYTDQAAPLKWHEQAGRYTVNRTSMIDNFFMDLKLGKIKAFNWNEFRPFAKDILNVRQEVIGEHLGRARRVWRRYPTKPDDSLHSMVFGWIACRVLCYETDFRT